MLVDENLLQAADARNLRLIRCRRYRTLRFRIDGYDEEHVMDDGARWPGQVGSQILSRNSPVKFRVRPLFEHARMELALAEESIPRSPGTPTAPNAGAPSVGGLGVLCTGSFCTRALASS